MVLLQRNEARNGLGAGWRSAIRPGRVRDSRVACRARYGRAVEKANIGNVHVRRKVARLGQPHIAPLVHLADGIARSRGLAAGSVPYPDPDHGGTHAEVLFLLTSPGNGARADTGSGLLSLENNDEGAARCHRETDRVGLKWGQVVHWNVVPFPTVRQSPTRSEIDGGAYWLHSLLGMLHSLRVVVLLGAVPEISWTEGDLGWPGLSVLTGPSPGPQGMLQSGAAQRLRAAFDGAAKVLAAA